MAGVLAGWETCLAGGEGGDASDAGASASRDRKGEARKKGH